MTSQPSYCTPYWTVEAVAALMDHAGTGIVPGLDELVHRKLIGVVTDRDLCLKVVAPGKYPAHTWVTDCSIRSVVTPKTMLNRTATDGEHGFYCGAAGT